MTTFNPFRPALVRDPTNEAVWEWPAGVTPAQWDQGRQMGAARRRDHRTELAWPAARGLAADRRHDAHLPLPDDCPP